VIGLHLAPGCCPGRILMLLVCCGSTQADRQNSGITERETVSHYSSSNNAIVLFNHNFPHFSRKANGVENDRFGPQASA